MNVEWGFRRHDERQESRWIELIRFVCSAIGIWAMCATGIYLIGPSEPETASPATSSAEALAASRMPVAVAGYEP